MDRPEKYAAVEVEASLLPTSDNGRDAALPGHRLVFISHASEDAHLATEVCSAIEEDGGACWIAPRDIQPGLPYLTAIADALESCSAVVVIVSGHTERSAYVVRELEMATARNVLIVPLLIERTNLHGALKLLLSGVQYLDAASIGLDNALQELVKILRPVPLAPNESQGPPQNFLKRLLPWLRLRPSKLVVPLSISLVLSLLLLLRPYSAGYRLSAGGAGAWSAAQGGADAGSQGTGSVDHAEHGGARLASAGNAGNAGSAGANSAGRSQPITCCTESGVGKPCYQSSCAGCGLRDCQ